jgi:hypothetical protein
LRAAAACVPIRDSRQTPSCPERTLLYRTVAENLETLLRAAREQSESGLGLSKHAEKEFREYLRCGIPCLGFTRLRGAEAHLHGSAACTVAAQSGEPRSKEVRRRWTRLSASVWRLAKSQYPSTHRLLTEDGCVGTPLLTALLDHCELGMAEVTSVCHARSGNLPAPSATRNPYAQTT